MRRQALEPNMVTYSGVLNAYEQGQELRWAFDACTEMPRQALEPILVT